VKGGHFALVAPYMVPRYGEDPNRNGGQGQEPRALSVENPMPTIVPTQNGAQLVAPVIAGYHSPKREGDHRTKEVSAPLATQTVENRFGLVAAFLAQHNGGFYDERGGAGRSVEQPLSTLTAAGSNQQVVQATFGVKLKGTCQHGQQLDLPLATVQAEGQHHAATSAFMVAYYGNEKDGQGVDESMRTLTARDRLGLVMVEGVPHQIVDIGMRMLVPVELYAAQGFPRDYKINITFKGKPLPKDAQVRMCGNSVSPYPCAELVRANFVDVEEAAAA
jgi:DNA (cytosine-5)-methyltransferase 1